MTKASNALRLDAGHNTNWNLNAQPVAILNEASTLHERIAYCWGLSNDLLSLSAFLNEHQSSDVARVSGLFFNQIMLLTDMLHHMGQESSKNGGAA
jgi:hypothetical protein